jgi:hypothetical protein
MFKRLTKRQLLIRRIIFSTIATLSVLVILTVTILFLQGFRLDSGNRLSQGALLQFDSTPDAANIYIDDKDTGVRTAGKQTVVAGTHAVRFTKDKYEDWNRTVDFAAGTLTWLDYARMVPKDRPTQTVASFETAVGAKASPDNKYMMVQEVASEPVFQLADLRATDVKVAPLTLPASLYSEATTAGVAHTFTLDQWNDAGRFILIKHAYADQTEWLMVDTENVDQSINISKLLSVGFKDMRFAGSNGRTLFALSDDNNIRKLDLSSATISRALVSNVESFDLFNTDTISYIGIDPADASKRVAGIYQDGDDEPHVLRTVASLDTVLKIAVGTYFNDNYVAIGEGSKVTILKGSYQISGNDTLTDLKQFATMDLPGAITSLSLSPKSDYILAEAGTSFATYEIEHTRSASGKLDSNATAQATSLRWLDISHMWNIQNGTLVMRDFDNANSYAINAVAGNYDALISQNGRFFYSIGSSDTGFTLQRVKMILD